MVNPPATPPPATAAAPVTYRDFGDAPAVRSAIYDRVLRAARQIQPVANSRYSLHLADVDYEDPEDYPLRRQKEAVLRGETLHRRLRGTWTLKDAQGAVLGQKRATVAQVPYLSPRGTFVIGGNEYTLKHQLRLRAGTYARLKENGELEAHANILPGKGVSHRYALEPSTGVFNMSVAQSNIPLFSVLKHVYGLDDRSLRREWGNELFEVNARRDDPRVVDKLYQRLVRRADPAAPADAKAAAVKAALEKMEFDADVNARTLGHGHQRLDAPAVLAMAKKLLAVNRGEADSDDRDDMAYQQFLGPEDLIAERMSRPGSALNQLLWKVSTKGNLDALPTNALGRHVQAAILDSGLGQALEEVNPLDVFDQQTAVSRLGTGGIPSIDSIPDSARDVHASQTGYIDLLRTPESMRAGVDGRVTFAARKGSDGRLYAPYTDPRTGQTVYKSPQDVSGLTLAFPGELRTGEPYVRALVKGRPTYVPRNEVHLELPHAVKWSSPVSNLVPLMPSVKGQRVSMGSRFATQALSILNAEAPLVRGQVPGSPGRSFEQHYGKHMGAVFAKDQPGRVEAVTADGIRVRYADGTSQEHETYENFPYNRKSVAGATQIFVLRDRQVESLLIKDYQWRDGDQTLSIDPDTKKPAWLPVTGYLKHQNDKRLFRVTTDSGREVVVTEDHSLVTIGDDGHLTPIYPLDCVVNRTRLPVATLPPWVEEGGREWFKLGQLVGLYLAEGHCPPSQPGLVVIAVTPKDRQQEVLQLLRELGHLPYVNDNKVQFTDHERCQYLVGKFGHMSYGKYVPAWVLRTPAFFRRGLVAGYMAGDGCLWEDVGGAIQVMAVSVSKKLRDGMVDVLASLGVFTTLTDAPRAYIQPQWRDGYAFRVISGHLKKLHRWFFYTDREKKFRGLCKDAYRSSTFEMVPVPTAATRKLIYAGFDEVPRKIYKAAHYGAVAKSDLAGRSGVFGLWGDSAVMWDKIVAIEPVAHEEWVYDLCVAKSETFAVCHGLVVHNSYLHNTAVVRPGDPVSPGQLLAKSNYTDDKGDVALGLNLRVAFVPWGGLNYEDAWVVSQGAANKLTSEHMYQHTLDYDDDVRKGKKAFVGIFPAKFDKKTLSAFDDDGVVLPGTRVKPGDPLVLAAAERPPTHKSVHAGHKGSFADRSVLWEHHNEGVVTDVAKTARGVLVAVKSSNPLQVGDKIANRYGGKGVVARIVPDEDMPRDPVSGEPYEILANPLGTISRGNPSQNLEAWLGKVARKTGKPVVVEDFDGKDDMTAWVIDRLREQGLEGKEDVEDPRTGRKVNVSTGVSYFMKLHHTSESKHQGRGLGAYTSEETPAKGGAEGSKRLALMDVNALLSHGALDVLRDAKLIRGQKNPEYWATRMAGHVPATPPVPLVYRKFVDQLRGAGVNVQRKGSRLHLMALTDKDVDDMAANRQLASVETVDQKGGELAPVPGGLFDVSATGGHGGQKWSYIKLHEPLPNPVFEEPIRHLLKLTGKEFEDVLAGRSKLDGRTGPGAFKAALSKINVPEAVVRCREDLRSSRRGLRDAAVRRLGYLKAAERTGVHPGEWVLSKVPVLPPVFRPVSTMQNGSLLVADANYLYKELWDANEALRELSGKVDDVSDERVNVYKAFKAVTGLGDPVQPKNQERRVKGLLAQIFGDSPKFGCFDDETEILTPDGWIPFPELGEIATVGTLNPGTGAFEWQATSGVFHWDYNGELFWFGTKRGLDCLVTPNHRNWVRRRGDADDMEAGWEIERAYVTAARGDRKWFRTAASSWEGHLVTPDFLPSDCRPEDFAAFVGWWAAEGWLTHGGKTVQLCQSVGQEAKCLEISRVVRALGEKHHVGRYENRGRNGETTVFQWSIHSPRLAAWLKENVGVGAECKSLTAAIRDWASGLLIAFLLAYLGGDGTRRHEPRRNGGGVTHKNHRELLDRHQNCHSVSRKLADDIVEIACKLGLTGRVRLQHPGDADRRPLWRVNLSGSRFVVLDGPSCHRVEKYTGRVHCVSVPNGIVYVRRKGKPFFSGNTVQQKLLGATVDLVGRAVVVPNPDLSMDEVGLPESRAWEVYAPFLVRRLVRNGMNRVVALQAVKDRTTHARKALLDELDERPVLVNRAPVLHRYGMMAFYPRLVKGNVLQVSPLVVGGFNMDFDGDTSNYQVVADDDAAKEAFQKMLPSRNLINVASLKKPTFLPRQEYVGGLWSATASVKKDKKPRVFATVKDALQAYWRNEMDPDDPVEVLGE